MSDFESVHLTLRLIRLLDRLLLRVINPELALAHLPKFESVDWLELGRLNGVTRDDAKKASGSVGAALASTYVMKARALGASDAEITAAVLADPPERGHPLAGQQAKLAR